MKSELAFFGIVLAAIGTLSGVLNWYLGEFYLQTVDWEGPMLIVNRFSWIVNVLGVGAGVVLIGLALLQPPDEP